MKVLAETCSMAAEEYVPVSLRADEEKSGLNAEKEKFKSMPKQELKESTGQTT